MEEINGNHVNFSKTIIDFSINFEVKDIKTDIPVLKEDENDLISHLVKSASIIGPGLHSIVYHTKTGMLHDINVDFTVTKSIILIPDKIQSFINNVFIYKAIELRHIKSKSKKREAVQLRQICMYLLLNNTKLSTGSIGKYFDKDHATVLHARKTCNNLIETDKEFNKIVDEIEFEIVPKYFNVQLKTTKP